MVWIPRVLYRYHHSLIGSTVRSALVAFGTAALLLAASAITFVPYSPDVDSTLLDVRVRMTVPGGGHAQLYYDLDGRGFTEANSERVLLTAFPDPVAYYFPLSAGTFHAFRFDPVDYDDEVEIHEIVILAGEGDGEVVWRFDLSEVYGASGIEVAMQDEVLRMRPQSGRIDPSLQLPLSEPLKLPPRPRDWLVPQSGRIAVLILTGLVAVIWFTALLVRAWRTSIGGFTMAPGPILLKLVLVALMIIPTVAPRYRTISSDPIEKTNYAFQTRILCPDGGTAQLFYDVDGRGFSEANSSRVILPASPTPITWQFALPDGEHQGLRFDPIDADTAVEFRDPRIVSRDGSVVRELVPDDFTPVHDIERLSTQDDVIRVDPASGTVDPILMVKLTPPLLLGSGSSTGLLGNALRLALLCVAAALAAVWLAALGLHLRRCQVRNPASA